MKDESFNGYGLNNQSSENRDLIAKTIILECKSFFQTFLDIENHIIPEREDTRLGKYNEMHTEEAVLYSYSYVVNGAFAIELAIKYLLTLTNIDFCKGNKGHDLSYLFSLLLLNKDAIKEDREAILTELCKNGTQDIDTIKANVQSWSDCYNRYRYLFSHQSAGINGLFGEFVRVVCNYAIKKSDLLRREDDDSIEISIQDTALPD